MTTEKNITTTPITDINKQRAILTEQEWDIWSEVLPQNGTVVLEGPPGSGKTSIIRTIGQKLNFQFFEFALTHMDSADLGGLPDVDRTTFDFPVSTYTVNDWAVASNSRSTIIFLDEINRPAEDVINALLKVLEKRLGLNFTLNENVYIIGAGNLGMNEDGTTVTALDAAMNNRIIHHLFNPGLDEWLKAYGDENIHTLLTSFLKTDQGALYFRYRKNDTPAYATSRTWESFSSYLLFHKITSIEDIKAIVSKKASRYIGTAAASALITYLIELTSIAMPSMKEIRKFGKNLAQLNELNLTQRAYIVNSYKIKDIHNAKEHELEPFITTLPDDLIALMYARIIMEGIKTSATTVIDPEAITLSVNTAIDPYKKVLKIRKDISTKLIASYGAH